MEGIDSNWKELVEAIVIGIGRNWRNNCKETEKRMKMSLDENSGRKLDNISSRNCQEICE